MNLKELKLKIMNEMIRLRNEGLVEQDCVMNVLEDTIDPFVEEREKEAYEKAEAEFKGKLMEFFNSDKELDSEIEQKELWKNFGLKLVFWDFENNKLDEKAEQLFKLSKEIFGENF